MARKNKGHAKGRRKGRALRKRHGHSHAATGGVRLNVTGQLVLDPVSLESVIEKAVETAVEESVPEAVEEAIEEDVHDYYPHHARG
jgi:hypothetical protein